MGRCKTGKLSTDWFLVYLLKKNETQLNEEIYGMSFLKKKKKKVQSLVVCPGPFEVIDSFVNFDKLHYLLPVLDYIEIVYYNCLLFYKWKLIWEPA